ncbi:MAG: glycosyltransferase [Desulfovibrio sp.]|nr:glycosyltransferase [Desulfovibrio sp.]
MPKIAFIFPAYNEEQTIADTLRTFHGEVPEAELWVIDNNSSDDTAKISKETLSEIRAGGGVLFEKRQGKGNAVRKAFREIDADYYLISDADLTYPAAQARELLAPVLAGDADMTVGDRHANGRYKSENKRTFHNFGNHLVLFLINTLFSSRLSDIMSGYRAFNRQFVKNYPILVEGFEIETDMTLHALDKRFRIAELPIDYKDRPEGSTSKLNTFHDGLRVIKTIINIFRYYKPLCFFGILSLFFFLCGLVAAIPVLGDYIAHGYIYHVPLALLATGLEIVALLMLVVGLILDQSSYYNKCNFERKLLDD